MKRLLAQVQERRGAAEQEEEEDWIALLAEDRVQELEAVDPLPLWTDLVLDIQRKARTNQTRWRY